MEMLNLTFDKLTVAKCYLVYRNNGNVKFCIRQAHRCQMLVCQTLSDFSNKKVIPLNFAIFLHLQMYFWAGYVVQLHRYVPSEGCRCW